MAGVADFEVLQEIQYHCVEPPDGGRTFPSLAWSRTEILTYFDQRARQFLKDTGILQKRTTLNTIPGNFRHALPADWISTSRVVWNSAGVFTDLSRSDTFDLDHGQQDWQYNSASKPIAYTETEVPTLQIQTAPKVQAVGVLEILHTYIQTTFSVNLSTGGFYIDDFPTPVNSSGTISASDLCVGACFGFGLIGVGAASVIPQEFFPAIKWGVLADMLWGQGTSHDPIRAGYAEQRYQEGVAAALLMMDGFSLRGSRG